MSKWYYGLAALVLAAAPAAAEKSAAGDATAVVKKAVAAHGGAEALNKAKAAESTFTGQMTAFGMDVDFSGTSTYQLPDKFRLTLDLNFGGAKQSIVQVANGKQVRTTADGKPQKISDASKAELLQTAAMQEVTMLTPLLEGKKYKLKAEKDADLGGAPAAVVVVSADGLKDVRLFFDKKTGLLVRTVHKAINLEEKEVTEETVQSDFKTLDGVVLPMKLAVTHDGKKFMTVTVTGVKTLEKPDPKLFAVED